MSLLFSEITFRRKGNVATTYLESGNPDEHDIRELLKYEDRYASLHASGLEGVTIQVQQYRYLGGSARERLAEEEHIALIEAYNELTRDELFTQRDDVEHLEYYEFRY